MRLAINGRFLSQNTTGVQRMAREFTRALDGLLREGALTGLDVRLLVPSDAQLGDLQLSHIRLETVRGGRGQIWEQLILPWRARGDVLLNLGNSAPLISLLGPRRVAVVVHDLSERVFPGAYRWQYRLVHGLLTAIVMRRAQPIITVADTEKRMILLQYPASADRIVVAPNGGWRDDGAAGPAEGPLEGGAPYGLYVGSFSRRKNIHGVIEAAIALARRRGLHFKFVGASSAILAEIRTEIPSDIAPMIEFCGQVEETPALRRLYAGASLLLFPSFYEASALPPIEAMAEGCPVVAADIPSLRERCRDAAIYCDPAQPSAIVAAAETLLDDAALRARQVARGRARAAMFSWRRQALTIIEALRADD